MSEQVQYAAAILLAATNALQQQVAAEPNLTFSHSLIADTALNQQIADAITMAAAHALIAGDGIDSVLDDTAYIARSMVTSLENALQTQTTDALAIRFAANLMADNALHITSHTPIIINALYALIANTVTQLQVSDRAIVDLAEFVMALDDAIQTLPDISPTLSAIFTLLINDSSQLILTDDINVARAIIATAADVLHELAADKITFGQLITLIVEGALQTQTASSPRISAEQLVALVREVLARGYYFFKAKDKLRR